MKASNKPNNKQAQQRPCVKIQEYKYEKGINRAKSNSEVHTNNQQSYPLKILAHKLSLASQNTPANQNISTQRVPYSAGQLASKQFIDEDEEHQQWFKKMLTPRDTLFKPKRSMFNRFNYENYHNYEYKNPFKPQKYPIDDKMEHRLKVNPTHASAKNLQIVFCQRKYADFVEKTNQKAKQFYQTNKTAFQKTSSTNSPFSKQSITTHTKNKRHNSQTKNIPVVSYNAKKRKTTLSNYLQQFNTLQKLSDYMQREQKLNEKFLFQSNTDISKTVLLEIVIHRFQFFKKMKKKCRDHILKLVLGVEKLTPYYKINIHQYIKFIQLFVSRDADSVTVAGFIFKFLFQLTPGQISLQNAFTALDMISGTASRHKVIEKMLQQIFERAKNKAQHVYQAFQKDEKLQNQFINLITL